jgi:glycosyltransferase involved in cell wall biosynthesis
VTESSTGRKTNIVSISLKLPYRGVDHAGGDLLLKHFGVLTDRCTRLDAFATGSDDNVVAPERDGDIRSDVYRAHVIEIPRWRRTLAGKIVARGWRTIFPVFPDLGVCTAFTASKVLREHVAGADVVELQWFEYFFFARLVRRINPHADVIGYVHDVPRQRLDRGTVHWPKAARRVYLAYAAMLERRLLDQLTKVAVLSGKDAELLAERGASPLVAVLNPPLESPQRQDAPDTSPFAGGGSTAAASFGFVGALHRPENDDAGLWLLREMWPHVVDRCRGAHLYLVGSKPSAELQQEARRFPESVTVTGYVEDIERCYDLFQTVVIPLRYGAGVKFKTIAGILAGKNVVATPTAIEGILPQSFFFSVSDSARVLTNAMIELAEAPGRGSDIAARARREVGALYSFDNYSRAVADFYGLG